MTMLRQWWRRWRRKKTTLLLICLLVAGGYYLQAGGKSGDPVAALAPAKADRRVVAEGQVVPINYSALSLQQAGVVAELAATEGQTVKAGQLLIRLDNRDLRAKVDSAAADHSRALANLAQTRAGSRSQEIAMKEALLEQARANMDGAKADYERMRDLLDKSAVSRQQFDQYQTAFFKSRGEWEHARANRDLALAGSRPEAVDVSAAEVAAAAARWQELAATFSQTELYAPFDGVVAFLDVKAGEYVAAGGVLVRMADQSRWLIRTDDLTELGIDRVRPGAAVKMTFDAIPGLELTGRVINIRAFGEKKRGDMTYTVFIEPERHESRLRWNMTAIVSIEENK